MNCLVLVMRKLVLCPRYFPLKLYTIVLPRMTLASSKAVTRIRGANEITCHARSSVALQGRGPEKKRPAHQEFGITRSSIEILSIRSIHERGPTSEQASKGGHRGTKYRDRSAAKSLLITLGKTPPSDPDESTRQHLTVGACDPDQSRIFARETPLSAQLLTVHGMHAQGVYTRRQGQQRQYQGDENKLFHLYYFTTRNCKYGFFPIRHNASALCLYFAYFAEPFPTGPPGKSGYTDRAIYCPCHINSYRVPHSPHRSRQRPRGIVRGRLPGHRRFPERVHRDQEDYRILQGFRP